MLEAKITPEKYFGNQNDSPRSPWVLLGLPESPWDIRTSLGRPSATQDRFWLDKRRSLRFWLDKRKSLEFLKIPETSLGDVPRHIKPI